MELRILGPFEATCYDRRVDLGGPKPRVVLALLVIHANQVVSADRLIDAVWPDSPPASALNTLQTYISHLRQAFAAAAAGTGGDIAPLVRTQAPGYALAVEPDAIDARRFERLLDEGRAALAASDPALALEQLTEGLSLWRGPALVDLAYHDFASVEVARLEELRLAALEEQADAELALGRHAEVVARLRSLLEDHPLRERLWCQLMLGLYRCGRQADALRAFQRAKRHLGEELGIEPSRALMALEADILVQAPALDWT
ncbi:MAG: AfsR/SARP family transcriptional regulator, partial [Acidimicrobiales bacterium]